MFEAPKYEQKLLHHIYNANNALGEKLLKNLSLTKNDKEDVGNLAPTYMLCYLNGFEEALDKLNELTSVIKKHSEHAYQGLKDTQRILRKIKYH